MTGEDKRILANERGKCVGTRVWVRTNIVHSQHVLLRWSHNFSVPA